MRHLTLDQATAALRRGRQIDQLLGRHELEDGKVLLRWLSVSPAGRGYSASLHEVFETELHDATELTPANPEEYVGEGRHIESFDDERHALESLGDVGASVDQWVNFGMIQDEINDARSRGHNGAIDLSPGVLSFLLGISDRADPPPWQSWLDDRDGPGGDSFIMVGTDDDRAQDIYIQRDTTTRSNNELDAIAYARTYLPLLIAEVTKLRDNNTNGLPNVQSELHRAAFACDENPELERLLGDRASVNATDIHGWTPLHHSAAHGYTANVKALLRADADADAQTHHGLTPIDLARQNSHHETVAVLLGDGR